ncbi:hypothetical protein DFH08DRAFT_1084077 [Mycena albidolilacea]|uniref:Uncharacterized protein n=1 Tax=Mycena albidolilacea TaxID=1033008 RepID=A0AAD6ZNF6_9AGAR|nr:hypothetical protein DFH08DRAFT_1084077 [Mycena albidolilacea]
MPLVFQNCGHSGDWDTVSFTDTFAVEPRGAAAATRNHRAMLAEIELEIARLESYSMRYLSALVTRREEAEAWLQEIVYPVRTFPAEIMSLVFVECLPRFNPLYSWTHPVSGSLDLNLLSLDLFERVSENTSVPALHALDLLSLPHLTSLGAESPLNTDRKSVLSLGLREALGGETSINCSDVFDVVDRRSAQAEMAGFRSVHLVLDYNITMAGTWIRVIPLRQSCQRRMIVRGVAFTVGTLLAAYGLIWRP